MGRPHHLWGFFSAQILSLFAEYFLGFLTIWDKLTQHSPVSSFKFSLMKMKPNQTKNLNVVPEVCLSYMLAQTQQFRKYSPKYLEGSTRALGDLKVTLACLWGSSIIASKVLHFCNTITQEAKTGGWQVWELQSESHLEFHLGCYIILPWARSLILHLSLHLTLHITG